MGRGDYTELTPSDAEVAQAEAETRRLFGRWGEPRPAPPPPALTARVLDAIEYGPARAVAFRHIWRTTSLTLAMALLPLLALGLWGVFGDSSGPARLLGASAGSLGQLALALTLAAKPLVNLLLGAGPLGLALAIVLPIIAWLWWRLVRVAPAGAEAIS